LSGNHYLTGNLIVKGVVLYAMQAVIVLGKFGLKPLQTQFKQNQNQLKQFGLAIFWLKPNGLISGLGVPTWFKLFKDIKGELGDYSYI